MRKGARLNHRQRRFVAEYLKDLNATQAAIRSGYSKKTAGTIGKENIQKPLIAAAVGAGASKQLQTAELSAARVLEELRRLGFSDTGALFDERGNLRQITELPADVRACIASVKTLKTNLVSGDGAQETTREVKLWDKTRALEMLAKHFQLLTDVVKLTTDSEIEARLTGVRARLNR